jgi:C4-dicarboxylate-specific signal transduction histidine kinase
MVANEAWLLALPLAAGLGYVARALLGRARRAQASKAADERLKLVLWSTGDELWELDVVRDQFIRTNPLRHLKASGYELVKDASALRSEIHPDDRPEFDRALLNHLKGETEHCDVMYRARDVGDQWRWLRTRGRVVERTPGGHALRMVGTTGDVTEFKTHEIELERLNRELESRVRQRTEALRESNHDLQHSLDALRQTQAQLINSEKMAALGGLVAGVAHEINTPLGIGVTAASHLEQETKRLGLQLEDGTLTKEGLAAFRQLALESAQLILRNLMRADKLVRSFKQVAVDQSTEDRRKIDLAVYLQEILTSLAPALKKTPYKIHADCPEGLVLDTYPGAIYQVVANLVMNSLMHGFRERPEGRITLRARREDDEVVLDYADDGRGMTEEVRKRVFEPFFTTRRGEGGSGLGMHIVWNLATQRLGGGITCDSEEGRGAHFQLRIPVSVAARPEAAAGSK